MDRRQRKIIKYLERSPIEPDYRVTLERVRRNGRTELEAQEYIADHLEIGMHPIEMCDILIEIRGRMRWDEVLSEMEIKA